MKFEGLSLRNLTEVLKNADYLDRVQDTIVIQVDEFEMD